jgi:hypothetical protein
MIAANIIIVVWSRIVYNLWEREEAYFEQVWNLREEGGDHQNIIRPSFHGTEMPTDYDSNQKETQEPESLSAARRIFSAFITVVFCSFVAAVIIAWYDIFHGRLTMISGALLAINVKIFDVMWRALIPFLIEFENHQYSHTYFDSYIWKTFAFQSVNNYCAYFYIAFKMQHHPEQCPDGDCMAMWQVLLIGVQLLLIACDIMLLIASSYKVKFVLWYEVYQYKKANNGKEPPDRARCEEEAKMNPFRAEDQIDMMCQLMLSLGFIILFGGVVPIMVPFCLLLFALNLRMGAQVLVTSTQRPFPRKILGIGAWKKIVALLMMSGMIFSGFMMVVNSSTFNGTPVVAKLTGLMLYCCVVAAVWELVNCVVPPTGKDTLRLRRQHQCVLSAIHRKCQDSNEKKAADKARISIRNSPRETTIARAAWSEVPPLALHPIFGSTTSSRSDDTSTTEGTSTTAGTRNQASARHMRQPGL